MRADNSVMWTAKWFSSSSAPVGRREPFEAASTWPFDGDLEPRVGAYRADPHLAVQLVRETGMNLRRRARSGGSTT